MIKKSHRLGNRVASSGKASRNRNAGAVKGNTRNRKLLKEAIEVVKANPKLNTSGQAAMYGMMAKIPFKGMIKGSVMSIMEKMYGSKNQNLDDKSDEVESWGDLMEKVGANALEVKRQVDGVVEKVKETFKR